MPNTERRIFDGLSMCETAADLSWRAGHPFRGLEKNTRNAKQGATHQPRRSKSSFQHLRSARNARPAPAPATDWMMLRSLFNGPSDPHARFYLFWGMVRSRARSRLRKICTSLAFNGLRSDRVVYLVDRSATVLTRGDGGNQSAPAWRAARVEESGSGVAAPRRTNRLRSGADWGQYRPRHTTGRPPSAGDWRHPSRLDS